MFPANCIVHRVNFFVATFFSLLWAFLSTTRYLCFLTANKKTSANQYHRRIDFAHSLPMSPMLHCIGATIRVFLSHLLYYQVTVVNRRFSRGHSFSYRYISDFT